jgi:tetratricopeptide (TPR) repeat protein
LDWLDEGIRKISTDDRAYRYALRLAIAGSHLQRGDPLAAEAALEETPTTILSSKGFFKRILWFRYMAETKKWQGGLDQAETVINEAFLFLRDNGLQDTSLENYLYLPLAAICYSRNKLDEALKYTTIALRDARQLRLINDIIAGTFLLSMIHLAKGDSEKARDCMQVGMKTLSKRQCLPDSRAMADAYTVLVSLMLGETELAEAWAEKRRLSKDEPFSIRFFFECLAQARLHYAKGNYQQAAELLMHLRLKCKETNLKEADLQASLLYGVTMYRLGKRGEAERAISQALSFAEDAGYVRLLADTLPLQGAIPCRGAIAASSLCANISETLPTQ